MFYLSCSVEHELIIFQQGKNSMGNEKTNIETEKTKIIWRYIDFMSGGSGIREGYRRGRIRMKNAHHVLHDARSIMGAFNVFVNL